MIYKKQGSTSLKLERIVIMMMMMMMIVRMMTRTIKRNVYHLTYTYRKNVLIYSTKLCVSYDVNVSSEIQFLVVSSPV